VATKFSARKVQNGEQRPLLLEPVQGRGYDIKCQNLNLGSDPEKAYNYSTFPGHPPLSPSALSPPLIVNTVGRRAMTALLFALAFLTLSSALPRLGGGLTDSLVERQFTSPAPDFQDDELPHNITDYDPVSWTLSTETLITNHYQTQPYVANGYHGSRVPAEGIGYWVKLPGNRVPEPR